MSTHQCQNCYSAASYVHFQDHLLRLLKIEKKMHNINESNYHFWNLLSAQYSLMSGKLLKMIIGDFQYFSLYKDINKSGNSEIFQVKHRMLDSYELMMIISQSLRRIHYMLTKFHREQSTCYERFQQILLSIQRSEGRIELIDQCLNSVKCAINIM